ncbi:helix-turn-helix domain-containing protein [Coraliomargarita sp. SDUM461004]|uniref:Helix-turn-helix domain-containing protein n=1 Tax=Thalassobacterium sedimentorum TaxID=3041258 RepID=A0ABU1AE38_9BACT|nr:helix-turn-helix domain-containing protein [Coraliomargarita sp. SDUM461004]MDQ8193022.1 helix-turn-helix domain-containing protein [Coraliomargarita sp. SDUM461004]
MSQRISQKPKKKKWTTPYKEWLYLNTRLFWVYDGLVDPYALNTERYISNYAVWYIQQGSVVVDVEGKVISACAGEWVFLRPGLRRQKFTENAEIISVHFQASWPNGRNLFEDGLSLVVKGEDFPYLEKYAERLLDSYRRRISVEEQEHIVWTNIEQINQQEFTLSDFLRFQKPFSDWLSAFERCLTANGLIPTRISDLHQSVLRGIQLIEAMPKHQPFRREELAAKLGMSASNADRLFQKYEGKSMFQVYDENRLRYARDQLSLAVVSVKSLAFEIGFHDLSNFSRWFKRLSGYSPREYKKRFSSEALD